MNWGQLIGVRPQLNRYRKIEPEIEVSEQAHPEGVAR